MGQSCFGGSVDLHKKRQIIIMLWLIGLLFIVSYTVTEMFGTLHEKHPFTSTNRPYYVDRKEREETVIVQAF